MYTLEPRTLLSVAAVADSFEENESKELFQVSILDFTDSDYVIRIGMGTGSFNFPAADTHFEQEEWLKASINLMVDDIYESITQNPVVEKITNKIVEKSDFVETRPFLASLYYIVSPILGMSLGYYFNATTLFGQIAVNGISFVINRGLAAPAVALDLEVLGNGWAVTSTPEPIVVSEEKTATENSWNNNYWKYITDFNLLKSPVYTLNSWIMQLGVGTAMSYAIRNVINPGHVSGRLLLGFGCNLIYQTTNWGTSKIADYTDKEILGIAAVNEGNCPLLSDTQSIR